MPLGDWRLSLHFAGRLQSADELANQGELHDGGSVLSRLGVQYGIGIWEELCIPCSAVYCGSARRGCVAAIVLFCAPSVRKSKACVLNVEFGGGLLYD